MDDEFDFEGLMDLDFDMEDVMQSIGDIEADLNDTTDVHTGDVDVDLSSTLDDLAMELSNETKDDKNDASMSNFDLDAELDLALMTTPQASIESEDNNEDALSLANLLAKSPKKIDSPEPSVINMTPKTEPSVTNLASKTEVVNVSEECMPEEIAVTEPAETTERTEVPTMIAMPSTNIIPPATTASSITADSVLAGIDMMQETDLLDVEQTIPSVRLDDATLSSDLSLDSAPTSSVGDSIKEGMETLESATVPTRSGLNSTAIPAVVSASPKADAGLAALHSTDVQSKEIVVSPMPKTSPISRPKITEGPAVPTEATAKPKPKRSEQLLSALENDDIDKNYVIKSIYLYGVPEDKLVLRSLIWKLVLNYIPFKKSSWASSLESSRNQYKQFIKTLITNPYKDIFTAAEDDEEKKVSNEKKPTAPKVKPQFKTVTLGDDPLSSMLMFGASSEGQAKPEKKSKSKKSTVPNTKWQEFYRDQQIREEIEKDIKRTYANFNFFCQRVKPDTTSFEEQRSQLKAKQKKKKPASLFDPKESTEVQYSMPPPKHQDEERHHDVLQRILFLYAKLNPGIHYVQGMNEILAPIYYVFAQDKDPLFDGHAEPDAFFCFTLVMADIRDRFMKSLDEAPTGIMTVVNEMNQLLAKSDPQLWRHLEKERVDPRFYSFKWITCLLSQEFDLPEVLRLWDSLFADQERFKYLNFVCVTMLILIRQDLLNGDFADNLRLLQNYPPIDINRICKKSASLRRKINRLGIEGNVPTQNKVRNPANVNNRSRNGSGNNRRVGGNIGADGDEKIDLFGGYDKDVQIMGQAAFDFASKTGNRLNSTFKSLFS